MKETSPAAVRPLILTLSLILSVTSMPQAPSSRSNLDASIKHLTSSLLAQNTTTAPKPLTILSSPFDTRTPPRIKQQQKLLQKFDEDENSHPGIAEPVEDLDLIQHEKDKNFYEVEATTENGLSTWILLSGQTSSTVKPAKKVSGKNVTNSLVVEDGGLRGIKPLFRRRSTTLKPDDATTTVSTTTRRITTVLTTPRKLGTISTTTTKVSSTTLAPTIQEASTPKTNTSDKIVKLTKIKASVLASAKNQTKQGVLTSQQGSTTKKPNDQTTLKPTTEFIQVSTSNLPQNDSSLAPEAKEGELELTTKKPKRSGTAKRKKNKNKKKKPQVVEDRIDVNSTKVAVKPQKGKPIGTQIYNYLSREVMPTVGVGLVGLMVTAGLASYFLYPFGPARRSYEDIDRKDTQKFPTFYNEYSGGISEEEAIGKVIAGMPTNTFYKEAPQKERNTLSGRYRKVDQRIVQASVETVHLNPKASYKTEEVIVGSPKLGENLVAKPENLEQFAEQKFVVGNVPKELQNAEVEVAPAVVPEHGPRHLDDFTVPQIDATKNKVEHGPRRRRGFKEGSGNLNGSKLVQGQGQGQEKVVVKVEKGGLGTSSGNLDGEVPKLVRNLGATKTLKKRVVGGTVSLEKVKLLRELHSGHLEDQEHKLVAKLGPNKTSKNKLKVSSEAQKHQLRRRKRQSDEENEISSDERPVGTTLNTTPSITTADTTSLEEEVEGTEIVPTSTKNPMVETTEGFIHMLKDLIYFKLRLGFEVLQNKTASLAKYLRDIQIRIDENYKNIQHL